jgi:hypothetical protein
VIISSAAQLGGNGDPTISTVVVCAATFDNARCPNRQQARLGMYEFLEISVRCVGFFQCSLYLALKPTSYVFVGYASFCMRCFVSRVAHYA